AYSLGDAPRVADLPIQFVDFACWQRQWLTGDVLTRQVDYWKTCLNGAPELLELPTDRPRPARQSFKGSTRAFHLPAEFARSLGEAGRRHDATLFMVMLAALDVLLFRYTGQEDLVV